MDDLLQSPRDATQTSCRYESKVGDLRHRLSHEVHFTFIHRVSEIYERLSNKKIPDHVRSLILELSCDDIDGNEIDNVPIVNYAFR